MLDPTISKSKCDKCMGRIEARLEKNRVGVAEYESDREVMRRTMGY